MAELISVEARENFRVWAVYDDGVSGWFDMAPVIPEGSFFEDLVDPILFAQVRIDPDWNTIEWPNGADIAPETLREEVERSSNAQKLLVVRMWGQLLGNEPNYIPGVDLNMLKWVAGEVQTTATIAVAEEETGAGISYASAA